MDILQLHPFRKNKHLSFQLQVTWMIVVKSLMLATEMSFTIDQAYKWDRLQVLKVILGNKTEVLTQMIKFWIRNKYVVWPCSCGPNVDTTASIIHRFKWNNDYCILFFDESVRFKKYSWNIHLKTELFIKPTIFIFTIS